MRAIVTGQVGVDKKPYLQAAAAHARRMGMDLTVCHVGEMMYREAPDVPAGRILNLPMARLGALRRSVFKEILRLCEQHEHVLVNTHATFRWRHGLFAAFDYDQMKAFNADYYFTLLDNVENVHQRLLRDYDLEHTLKDIMVWREEELLATEILATIARGHGRFFLLARGRGDLDASAATLARLLVEPRRKKVYLSFPMSHVADQPRTLATIEQFKTVLSRKFITFDPADVDELLVHLAAVEALRQGRTSVQVAAADGPVQLKTAEVAEISGDIMGQIYARDFKMIDQADMIVALIPASPAGLPLISSGVERELHHAFEAGKEVYVIWQPAAAPSPFITETATAVFPSVEAAMRKLESSAAAAAPL